MPDRCKFKVILEKTDVVWFILYVLQNTREIAFFIPTSTLYELYNMNV